MSNTVDSVSHFTSTEHEPSWLGIDFLYLCRMQLGQVPSSSAMQQSRCAFSPFASRRKCAFAHRECLCLLGNFRCEMYPPSSRSADIFVQVF
ncbi:hypothetical protein AVEN_208811-1 [Araneus ventricosus]|uniref:Uncharacterized protein n=1 Tax=Araneus ventricosus TaxID=182803 RepID=A0A4Y2L1Z5_ARAVE|nr:hypothetical protein AVEN_195474-1 [Araneus ventricosus]GBN07646.1 hypothetical protein AVEN_225183-1 [Araneus ventricosus]GBN07664.1 hypothetical protein AVEN_12031-1 [Araneus ventricosus]GBN07726.1 hypothetical protein AVEN_208811-1 [Araneus ventricosus]